MRLEITKGDDPIPHVGILQRLTVSFIEGRWHAWGGDSTGSYHGQAEHHDGAILDWLAARLGINT